jgi:RNA polymerase-binding transcription factor DksA
MTHDALRETLLQRRAELRDRATRIASDLRRETDPSSPDAPDRAIQRENDEVLMSLGDAANAEIARIEAALQRLAQPGGLMCHDCGRPIEPERLAAVPDAVACGRCSVGAPEGVAQDTDLDEAFRACDEDGDGAISLPEFRRLLARCGSSLTPERQAVEFLGIDRNHDWRIDRQEFRIWWEAR